MGEKYKDVGCWMSDVGYRMSDVGRRKKEEGRRLPDCGTQAGKSGDGGWDLSIRPFLPFSPGSKHCAFKITLHFPPFTFH